MEIETDPAKLGCKTTTSSVLSNFTLGLFTPQRAELISPKWRHKFKRVFFIFVTMSSSIKESIFIVLLLGLGLLLPSNESMAQLSFGLSGGLNYGGFDDIELGDSGATYDARSGYHIGGFVDVSAGPLALRPGIYYLNVGAIFSGIRDNTAEKTLVNGVVTNDYLIETDRFDLEFISVPIDVRLRMGLPFLAPYIFGGPELRFRSDSAVDEYIDNVKPFNLSGNAGVGMEINIGYMRLMPELRYAFDISGWTGDDLEIAGRTFSTGEHILNSILLRVGLVF